MSSDLNIRLATASDSAGIIALIDSVYGEYNDGVNLEGAEADLLDLDRHYFAHGGAFWVLIKGERILGSHGAVPHPTQPEICNFRRLYLDVSLRGTEWGHQLMQVTIDWARERQFRRIEFWSDTRFSRAHRFFSKFGFVKSGEQREMHDGIVPYREWFFYLDFTPSE
ncbi:MAG TPA: GNAT family N-acetyltransferase [Pirellulaceae bacterium]|nr:GNAT family N-acetyltransferase [Pirellulaceae bacterium]